MDAADLQIHLPNPTVSFHDYMVFICVFSMTTWAPWSPLVQFSFCTGWLLLDDPLHRLGLFTLGCSPGGSASNFWTLLFNGDLNLSITMTFISTIIAMGMVVTVHKCPHCRKTRVLVCNHPWHWTIFAY